MAGVLVRVDAGPRVGLGHLQRCLSLAAALRHAGLECVFLTNRQPAAQARVARFGFNSHTVGRATSWDGDDQEETQALAHAMQCRTVVVDSDDEGAPYLAGLREAGLFVCAIEDLAPHPFPCQVVVNGDAHARELPYASSSSDTVFLLGPAYCMLREEFWSVPQRTVREVPQQVLVMLGGDDPHHVMLRLLRLLDELPGSWAVTAVIGPFVARIEAVESVAAQLAAHPIRVVRAPDSVCSLMMQADLAVSAGGQTLYELARVGCPTIAIRTAANQDGQLAVLERLGIIQMAGHAEDRQLLRTVDTALRRLLSDAHARSRMSQAGQRLVDGQGALRVAKELGITVRCSPSSRR